MSARISVIIPVYNMEEYIGKSVASVQNQTWTDLEIVVVDDGSTDRTGEILDGISVQDARVRVIHQKNGGVSNARNTGLSAAQGDYVAWLDGDDWMEPDALRRLMTAIDETGADVSLCNYENVERSGQREKRYQLGVNEVITGREALKRQIERSITQSLCFNLAPRAFYREVRFPEGELFEDVRNSWRMYDQAKKVALVNDTLLFNRLVRNESISHIKTVAKRAASCEAYLIRQEELTARWPESEEVFVRSNHASLLLQLRQAVLRDSKENFEASRETIRKVASYFRKRTRMALGNHPGFGQRLEYFFLTAGTRMGFYLSRLVSMPKNGGTWLR